MTPERLTELVPGVFVASARADSTLSTVLLDGTGGAVVVDPAWYPDELGALADDVQALGAVCVGGVATHEHYDHVLWHPELGSVPRWCSSATAAAFANATRRSELLAPAGEFLQPELLDLAGRDLSAIPGDHLPWDGPTALALVHDAHAVGHLALFLPDSGVLLVGDMLSDVELPMPDDDDVTLARYLAGLDALAPLVAAARWLIPGHGEPTDRPMARLDADRRYLDDLLAGRTSTDERIGAPGMSALHEANLARAARMVGRDLP